MKNSNALAQRTYDALPPEIRTTDVRAELEQVSQRGEIAQWLTTAIAYCRDRGAASQAIALASILSSLQPNSQGSTAVNVFDFSQTTIIGGDQAIASHNSHDESIRERRTVRVPVPRVEATDPTPFAALFLMLGVGLGMALVMVQIVTDLPDSSTPQPAQEEVTW
jgi:hypothetical protein